MELTFPHFDILLFKFLNSDIANPAFDVIMPFVTLLKHWIPVYILFILFMLTKQGKRGRFVIILLLLTVAVNNHISSEILKDYFGRIRPCHVLEDVRLLVTCRGGKSFPSSHASNNFAMAIVMIYYYRKYWWIFLTIALTMGFSRIYVGVHYPIDVFAGSILGIFIGSVFVLISLPLAKKLDITPLLKKEKVPPAQANGGSQPPGQ